MINEVSPLKIVSENEKCYICGAITNFVIHDKATLLRDAKCLNCGASIRNSDKAGAIIKTYMLNEESLSETLCNMVGLRILNTCSSGALHNVLHKLPGYIVSEYFDDIPNGEYKDRILSADLMDLPFDDNSIDLIISEDVFEHISNCKKAFSEIERTLVPGGYHIFTVPLHEGKRTKSRIGNEKKIYHGDPIRQGEVLQLQILIYLMRNILK